jgi:hypothetical protein
MARSHIQPSRSRGTHPLMREAAELVAAPKLAGLDPIVTGDVPEQVPTGGVDDRGVVPGLDLLPVSAMVNQDGLHHLSLRLAGLRVRGHLIGAATGSPASPSAPDQGDQPLSSSHPARASPETRSAKEASSGWSISVASHRQSPEARPRVGS